jgi:hypothetical protein
MKIIIEMCAFSVLLGGTLLFGVLGQPAEMALSIVAGALSFALVNIEKFSKLKGAGFEAVMRIEQVDAMLEKEIEPRPPLGGDEELTDSHLVDDNTREVMDALQNINYTWRYMGGLREDTGLSTDEISDALDWLISRGYARKSEGKQGEIWSLTNSGRYLSMKITRDRVSA